MKHLTLLIPVALLLNTLTVSAQQSEQDLIRQNKIKSVSELETDLRVRKAAPVEKKLAQYDAAGNLVEIIERDDSGLVLLHESYEYNELGQKTVEIQYEPNGNVRKKHVYKFVNNLRTERMTYDKNGKLIGQKKYVYEFHDK
jgi:uncharacterized protein RhaS with RHS repeats